MKPSLASAPHRHHLPQQRRLGCPVFDDRHVHDLPRQHHDLSGQHGKAAEPVLQRNRRISVYLQKYKRDRSLQREARRRRGHANPFPRAAVQDLLDLPGVEVEVWDHHPTPYSGEKNKVINADVTHIGTTAPPARLSAKPWQERGITRPVRKPPFSGSASTATRARSPTRPPSRKISSRGHGCASTAWICPSSLISSRRA